MNMIDKLKASINKSGFPTEMKVANIFINNEWEPEHSNYYIDLDENKGREIDIVASKTFMRRQEKYKEFTVSYVTEIKKEEKKPWVVFTSPISKFENLMGLPYHIVSNKDVHKTTIKCIDKYSRKVHERIGRTAFEGFGNGKDKLYSSLCNTVKAMEYLMDNHLYKDNNSDDQLISMFEPLIVLEGNLVEAYLDAHEELELVERDYLQVKFNYKSPKYNKDDQFKRYIINIVKKSYLDIYLKERSKEYKSMSLIL